MKNETNFTLQEETQNLYSNLSGAIGNTPLYQLKLKYKSKDLTIYGKAEHYNFTGSIKDRMAFYFVDKAIKSGELQRGMQIVEATSGNTGISFAGIGASLGYKVIILMPDWMSEERKVLIKSFGAEVRLISKEAGGFLGAIAQAEALGKSAGTYLPRQFENSLNPEAHYWTTGPEIDQQLQIQNIVPTAFVAGVGTGGTIMGIGRYLKEKYPSIKIYPLEPQNSPTLSTGRKIGKHRIQGISDDFIPSIVDFSMLDEIIQADDGDAINMAKKLSAKGMGVGISSGANLIGAIKVAEQLGEGQVVVTVFPDDNKKYLSTDLVKDEPVLDYFVSKDVEIVDLQIIPPLSLNC